MSSMPLLKNKARQWLLHFFLVNLFVVYVINFHYLSNAFPLKLYVFQHEAFHVVSIWDKCIAVLYLIITYLGYFSLLVLAASGLPYLCTLLFNTPKIAIITNVVTVSSLLFILLTDSYVFSIYQFHLNKAVLDLLLSPYRHEIFYFSNRELFVFYTGLICIVLFEAMLASLLWFVDCLRFSRLIRRGIMISIYFIVISLFSTGTLTSGIAILSSVFPFYSDLTRFMFAISNEKLYRFAGSYYFPTQSQKITLNYPKYPLVCQQSKQHPHIFIIMIDAWRFDALNEKITPNLAQFAKENLYFHQHFSGGNATKPGVFSLFYGLPATYWSIMEKENKNPLLMMELMKKNYQFGIFSSASLTVPNFEKTIFNGIPSSETHSAVKTSDERDTLVTQRFSQFMTKHDKHQPIFSFLFYDGVHAYCENKPVVGPFQPSIECNHYSLKKNLPVTPLMNRYLNAVHLADQQIGVVLATIKKEQLWDNSIVIITADHGEEFNDNQLNYWGHASNFTKYQTQVPFLIHWPQKTAQDYSYMTTHYDVAPTLLNQALGCDAPYTHYTQGLNLFDPSSRYPLIIANNFGGVAYLTPGKITALFASGDFSVQDLNGRELSNKKPNLKQFSFVLKKLNYFISNTQTKGDKK